MPAPTPAKINNVANSSNERSKWFDSIIGQLRAHEIQLETHTATPQIESLYQNFIAGNLETIALSGKQSATELFVTKIILEYFTIIQEVNFSKLAFDHNDSEVLVWIEISDDDFKSETKLVLAEAKINANFHNYGYHLFSTIVEKSDNLPVPNHYKIIK